MTPVSLIINWSALRKENYIILENIFLRSIAFPHYVGLYLPSA